MLQEIPTWGGRFCSCMYQPNQTEPHGPPVVCLYSCRLTVSSCWENVSAQSSTVVKVVEYEERYSHDKKFICPIRDFKDKFPGGGMLRTGHAGSFPGSESLVAALITMLSDLGAQFMSKLCTGHSQVAGGQSFSWLQRRASNL